MPRFFYGRVMKKIQSIFWPGILGCLIACGVTLNVAVASSGHNDSIVVELFTSQGCSSCPPAEAFLQELAGRDDVIALEFHVDYWDYIGWHDPFADPSFTNRQKNYVRQLGNRYVYTPQMIVDGSGDVVGSRRRDVEQAIVEARRARKTDRPEIVLNHTGEGIEISISPVGDTDGDYVVNLVGFDRIRETHVTRGENSGKILRNARVVRSVTDLGSWAGGKFEFLVNHVDLIGNGGCAVLVQEKGSGRVLTAAQLLFPGT